ncbi:hypothetical protein [Nitrosopumilus sp.]|uniref:hypothetical protein n=1 Tax=Nitrosopumilus sp. TaxID=2024843 RepID=UPI003B5CD28A
MYFQQAKFEAESSRDNLIETILKNRNDLETVKISEAIKDFVKNHERYTIEKKRLLDRISQDVANPDTFTC